ncbi:hypothetical protein Tco_0794806 [Tanacetum coccineum]
MAGKEAKSTTRKIVTNDQADYYSGITSIMINGKNAYELKGKFLDDLHKNDFSGTHREDAFVYYKTIDIFTKGALWDYWKLGSDEIEPTNEETANLEETNHDDEQEIGEILRIETNLFDYETPLCEKFKEFNYLLKIDPDLLTKDIKGFKTYKEYKDDWIYEWNENVPWVHEKPWTKIGDCKMKEKALRNKAVMEGLINDDDESSNNGWRRWDGYEITDHDQEER